MSVNQTRQPRHAAAASAALASAVRCAFGSLRRHLLHPPPQVVRLSQGAATRGACRLLARERSTHHAEADARRWQRQARTFLCTRGSGAAQQSVPEHSMAGPLGESAARRRRGDVCQRGSKQGLQRCRIPRAVPRAVASPRRFGRGLDAVSATARAPARFTAGALTQRRVSLRRVLRLHGPAAFATPQRVGPCAGHRGGGGKCQPAARGVWPLWRAWERGGRGGVESKRHRIHRRRRRGRQRARHRLDNGQQRPRGEEWPRGADGESRRLPREPDARHCAAHHAANDRCGGP